MTIEDEGIEPDFELNGPKKKGKEKVKSLGKSTHLKKGVSKKNEASSGVAVNVESKDQQEGTSSSPKKKIKRKAVGKPEEHTLLEEPSVPKKKKKVVDLSQPPAPAIQKKKKKLSKKKLVAGVPVEELAGKKLGELIELKPAEPVNGNASETKKRLKKKKKKKEEKGKTVELSNPVPPLKKSVQSPSEPSLPVEEEDEKQDGGLFDQEKKKKKKVKKVPVVQEQEKEKQADGKTGKLKKKKKKKTKNAHNLTEHPEESVKEVSETAPNPQPRISEKYKELLERLSSTKKEGEARQQILKDVEEEKIEEGEVTTVLRLWRQQKRRKMQAENKEKLIQMEGTLKELKDAVNDLVRKGKLAGEDAGDIIKHWKNREKRRVGRQIAKQTNRACFHCRQQGHVLADCPNRDEGDQATGNEAAMHGDGICFKCGSTEHSVHKCPRKHVKGFPYATCFVCGQQGHLSRDCEKNANGIYPDGGGCNVCGSTKHLKRDCPELAAQKQKKDERKVTIRTMSAMSSADADDVPEDEEPKKERKKSKKIVKF